MTEQSRTPTRTCKLHIHAYQYYCILRFWNSKHNNENNKISFNRFSLMCKRKMGMVNKGLARRRITVQSRERSHLRRRQPQFRSRDLSAQPWSMVLLGLMNLEPFSSAIGLIPHLLHPASAVLHLFNLTTVTSSLNVYTRWSNVAFSITW